MSTRQGNYGLGQSKSVHSVLEQRTAANSLAYLLTHISDNPSRTLLDVGCGPGSLPLDLARILHSGRVLGLDESEEALERARSLAKEQGVTNVSFIRGDVYDLRGSAGIEDSCFDVVHAHQVLIHLTDPVKALKEMRRVALWLVASRDAIASREFLFPLFPRIETVQAHFRGSLFPPGKDGDLGGNLMTLALKAGWKAESITFSCSVDTAIGSAARQAYYDLSIGYLQKARQGLIESGVVSEEEVEKVKEDYLEWRDREDAWRGHVNGELLARV